MAGIMFGLSALLTLACVTNVALARSTAAQDVVWVAGAVCGGVGMFAAATLV